MNRICICLSFFIGLSFFQSASANQNLCLEIFKSKSKITISDPPHFDTPVVWNNSTLWDKSMTHSNDFFIRYGWDKTSNSFASEISSDGKVLSDKRYIISTSRMVYGLAHSSSVDPSYLPYAKKQAHFLLNKMLAQDKNGYFFKATVDSKGNLIAPENQLVVNYQAYGLNGLVALYKVTKDPSLLKKIEIIYGDFYKRFHDPINFGFYDQFDQLTGKVVNTKSFNSTVYVATSFLVDLAELPTSRKNHYIKTVEELADKVAQTFPDQKTGWIIENFTSDWKPQWRDWQVQGESTIGITGHNYQAAWFLLRVAEFNEISSTKKTQYLNAARTILTSMLNSKSLDHENGGVFDAFKREMDEPMWHTNKAWWQQAEMILALTKAESVELFPDAAIANRVVEARDKALQFYFKHFVDYKNGGEFTVVQKDGVPVLTENKGQAGTGSYHQVELARMMKQYASNLNADNAVKNFFSNYSLIGDWTKFQNEQSKLLSPNMITIFSDHRGEKTYQAPQGYFASLGDWSQVFTTGPDFNIQVVSVNSQKAVVRLHGTLKLLTPINGITELRDDQHSWTEIFTFSKNGSIERLEVLMNISP